MPVTPRRLAFLLASLALTLGGVYAAFRIATRESSTPATVRDAVERFRDGPRALPPALRSRAPHPGVYVYATRGFERTHVLGARRHVYPARTTITISAGGCGLRMRWDALRTRWDAVEICRAGDAWRLATTSEEHEFLSHRDRRTYGCTPDSIYRPALLGPGAAWASRCAIEGTLTADDGVVVGLRTLTVADRPVRTLLLRIRTTVSGDTVGTGTTFTWVLPRTGLVVRRVVHDTSTTDTIAGNVRYVERYALMLMSLRPRR